MFKNLTILRVTAGMLSAEPPAFVSCGATQQQSIGFVPVTKGMGLLEKVGGDQFVRLQIETKKAPTAAVKRRAEELAADIEQQTGRKLGRKGMKELKEQALLELLPNVIPARKTIGVVLLGSGWLVIDSTSAAICDLVVTELIKATPGMEVQAVRTNELPASIMSNWLLTGEPAPDFTVDRECELKTPDEMKSVVRYARHPLDIDEVREHVRLGKVPTKLAVTFQSRVSFVLTAGLQLRKIETLAVGESEASAGDAESAWLAEAGLFAAEMTNLMPALIDALGGECEPAEQA